MSASSPDYDPLRSSPDYDPLRSSPDYDPLRYTGAGGRKPLLLVDVDGVLSLFGFDPRRPPAGRLVLIDGLAHFLSATAGGHLQRLAREFELVWCTGWEERANEHLPALLGLPGPFPLVALGPSTRPPRAHWKLAGIDRCVAPSRALAWIDDAHDERCVDWAAARPAPTLLVTTEPAVGLTAGEVTRLLDWAALL